MGTKIKMINNIKSLKNKIESYWVCPGCGHRMTNIAHDNLMCAVNCVKCKEYSTDSFIEENV